MQLTVTIHSNYNYIFFPNSQKKSKNCRNFGKHNGVMCCNRPLVILHQNCIEYLTTIGILFACAYYKGVQHLTQVIAPSVKHLTMKETGSELN